MVTAAETHPQAPPCPGQGLGSSSAKFQCPGSARGGGNPKVRDGLYPAPSHLPAGLQEVYLLPLGSPASQEGPPVQAPASGSLSGSTSGPSCKEPTLLGASLGEGQELGRGSEGPSLHCGCIQSPEQKQFSQSHRARCPHSQSSAFCCLQAAAPHLEAGVR